MFDFLVEYKMFWAGKLVKQGIEQFRAYNEFQAEKQCIEYLDVVNRKAEKQIIEVVQV